MVKKDLGHIGDKEYKTILNEYEKYVELKKIRKKVINQQDNVNVDDFF